MFITSSPRLAFERRGRHVLASGRLRVPPARRTTARSFPASAACRERVPRSFPDAKRSQQARVPHGHRACTGRPPCPRSPLPNRARHRRAGRSSRSRPERDHYDVVMPLRRSEAVLGQAGCSGVIPHDRRRPRGRRRASSERRSTPSTQWRCGQNWGTHCPSIIPGQPTPRGGAGPGHYRGGPGSPPKGRLRLGLARFNRHPPSGGKAPERMSRMETVAKKKPRPRRQFTPEFKAEIVERCLAGDLLASSGGP